MFGRRKNPPEEPKGEQVYAVIPAAGVSSRMGGINKLMLKLDGKPVLRYTLEAFDGCECIDGIVLSCRHEDIEKYKNYCREWGISKPVIVTEGGDNRTKSVYNGVLACPKSAGFVAIHDGARPFVTSELIEKTVDTAKRDTAAAPALPVTDSIKRIKNGRMVENIQRDTIVAVQTPQCFDIDLIRAALSKAIDDDVPLTDDCGAAEILGQPTTIVEGLRDNIKITSKEDIEPAEKILRKRKK